MAPKNLTLTLLIVAACGCGGQPRTASVAFDNLLVTGRIDRVAFLNYEKDKTNILADEHAEAFLKLLNSTNRIHRSTSGRNSSEGAVYLYEGTNYIAGLHYIPEYEALSFAGKYYFGIEGTNQLRAFFE